MDEIQLELMRRQQALMDYVSRAFDASQVRMDCIETNLAANTEATKKNTEISETHRDETQEMIEVFNSLKGGFKVLEWIGTAGKIVAGIVGGIGALIGVYHASTKFFK